MTTMNVSLPETMRDFVELRVIENGYGSSSEYIRDLIRHDQLSREERVLADLMREGLESGSAELMPSDYWDRKREAIDRLSN